MMCFDIRGVKISTLLFAGNDPMQYVFEFTHGVEIPLSHISARAFTNKQSIDNVCTDRFNTMNVEKRNASRGLFYL